MAKFIYGEKEWEVSDIELEFLEKKAAKYSGKKERPDFAEYVERKLVKLRGPQEKDMNKKVTIGGKQFKVTGEEKDRIDKKIEKFPDRKDDAEWFEVKLAAWRKPYAGPKPSKKKRK
jgi:ribosome-associated translation inhibitor RaiA